MTDLPPRQYAPHRHAYYPRLWPMLICTAPASFALVLIVRPFVLAFVLVGVLGVGVPTLRWWVWRRRHPVISAEQFAAEWREAMSRAARWN